MNTNQLYVVTGVTGRTGSAAAKALIEMNQRVRVVVRNASKGVEWTALGAEVAVADLNDTQALTEAFSCADGAYIVSPPQYWSKALYEKAQSMAQSIANAALAANLPKLVVLSSVGADKSDKTGWIAMNHMLEQSLKDSASAVAFLRAAYFMENWAPLIKIAHDQRQLSSFLTPLDRKLPMIATADIGRIAATTLCQTWEGIRILDLEGPARYSPTDVANHLADNLSPSMPKESINAVSIPESAWEEALGDSGFSSEAISGFIEMTKGLNSGHIAFHDESKFERCSGSIELAEVLDELTVS
ncbi:NmrA family NAD(P)-binding protein [Vibrio amylolyticus]|uniref:NmrA family NAD(P)-binding protein n=1 Tax=Vibrio amylolyticus TaxID=2847292 RepID=UPI003550B20D